jgi:hypothetical protein
LHGTPCEFSERDPKAENSHGGDRDIFAKFFALTAVKKPVIFGVAGLFFFGGLADGPKKAANREQNQNAPTQNAVHFRCLLSSLFGLAGMAFHFSEKSGAGVRLASL